jgi:hypothetical protein
MAGELRAGGAPALLTHVITHVIHSHHQITLVGVQLQTRPPYRGLLSRSAMFGQPPATAAPAFGGGFGGAFGGGGFGTPAAAAPAPSPFGGAFAAPPASAPPAFGFGAAAPAAAAPAAPAFGFGAAAPAAQQPFGAGGSLFGTPPAQAAAAAAPFGAGGNLFGGGNVFSAAPASAGALAFGGGMLSNAFAVVQPLPGGAPQLHGLLTKAQRPISHADKWEDLAPETQAKLLHLECVGVGACVARCTLRARFFVCMS